MALTVSVSTSADARPLVSPITGRSSHVSTVEFSESISDPTQSLVCGAPPQTLISDPKPGVGNCIWTVLRPLAGAWTYVTGPRPHGQRILMLQRPAPTTR